MQLSVAAGILRDIRRNGGGIGDWNGLQKDGRRQGYNQRLLFSKGRSELTGGTSDEMAETVVNLTGLRNTIVMASRGRCTNLRREFPPAI